MAEKIKRKRNLTVSFFFFLFGISFLVGIAMVFLWEDEFINHDSFLRAELMESINGLEVDFSKMLYLCIQNRLVKIIFLMILSFTNIGGMILCVVTSWMGCLAGMLLEILSLRYGLKGILLFIAGVFPQFIFYSVAYIGLINTRKKIWKEYYDTSYYGGIKSSKLKQWMKIVLVLVVFILGIITEVYINPSILLKIIEFL
ncbi:MAG: hypothetical protein R3Y24_04900 [Eubacteriales bacterium]